ncbi:hypothetical protein F4802DRAFT_610025 [Xylaria palmicola]|nr:hypothetical protein F4802DRAFT_610025 [Xylaria palmicola]
MKACTALPWSSAGIGRRVPRHSPRKHFNRCSSSERPRNKASPILPENTATRPSYDIDRDNKTIATAVGPLPLSPIMDPSYWEAITRYKNSKPKPGKAQNSLERQFRRNPYAKALATNIRQCTATHTRLPSFFLQGFNLISHPETDEPWWVPRSLLWEEPAETKANEATVGFSTNSQHSGDQQEDIETDGGELTAADQTVSEDLARSAKGKPYGPTAYASARWDVISAFTSEKSGYYGHNRRLFGGCQTPYKKLGPRAVWRRDMNSFILDRMRQEIVRDLLYLSRYCTEHDRYYIVKCDGWDDVQFKYKGSVLWFGEPTESGEAAKDGVRPGSFATYDITSDGVTTAVAVHNIPMLLGDEYTARLKQEAAVLSDGWLFMLALRRTTDLQAKLWQLQGYLAEYR